MTTSETLRTMAAIIDRLDLHPISASLGRIQLAEAEFCRIFAGQSVTLADHDARYHQLAIIVDGVEVIALASRPVLAPTSMVL